MSGNFKPGLNCDFLCNFYSFKVLSRFCWSWENFLSFIFFMDLLLWIVCELKKELATFFCVELLLCGDRKSAFFGCEKSFCVSLVGVNGLMLAVMEDLFPMNLLASWLENDWVSFIEYILFYYLGICLKPLDISLKGVYSILLWFSLWFLLPVRTISWWELCLIYLFIWVW